MVCCPGAPKQGIPLGRGDIAEGLLAISLLFYSAWPWAQEHQELICSPIRQNELECTEERAQRDRVTGFHGWNNKVTESSLWRK